MIPKRAGDRANLEADFAELEDFYSRIKQVEVGLGDGANDDIIEVDHYIEGVPHEDILAFSVFSLTSHVQSLPMLRLNTADIGDSLVLATNGSIPMTSGQPAAVSLITSYKPFRAIVTSLGVGWPAEIDGFYPDLTVLSEDLGDGTFWVARTTSRPSFVGKVATTISGFADPTLGSGTVNVLDEDENEVVDPNTGTAPWTLKVWNPVECPISQNQIISFQSVYAVGFIADHPDYA